MLCCARNNGLQAFKFNLNFRFLTGLEKPINWVTTIESCCII